MAEQSDNFHFYAEVIANGDIQKEYYGPAELPSMPISGGFVNHTVLPEQEFRCDKIAEFYYQNSNLSWVIDLANNFFGKDKFKAYITGRTIKIPMLSLLRKLKIIHE